MTSTSENEAKLVAAATPIFELLNQVGTRRMDPERTESFIGKIDRHLDRATEELARTSVNLGAAFCSLVENALECGPTGVGAPLNDDPLAESVRKLAAYFVSVERQWPMTIYSAMNGAGLATRSHFKTLLDCLGYHQQFAEKAKEPLSHLLWYSTISIVELYYSAIECVYQVECMKRGVIMSAKRGGEQLRRLSPWIKNTLPDFIDDDANHFRNAAAHRHWRYHPESDSVTVKDLKWERCIKTDELKKRIESIFVSSIAVMVAIEPSLHLLLLELRGCGVLDVIATGDGTALDQRRLDIRFDPTFDRLKRLKWTAKTDSMSD